MWIYLNESQWVASLQDVGGLFKTEGDQSGSCVRAGLDYEMMVLGLVCHCQWYSL